MNLEVLWLVMLGTGSLLLLVSLFLMLYWRVPSLIDKLSGRFAKKELEKLKSLESSQLSITSYNTGELNTISELSTRNDFTVSARDPATMSLKDRVADPYSLINRSRGTRKAQPAVDYVVNDAATSMLDDIPVKTVHKVVLKTEQSSLNI